MQIFKSFTIDAAHKLTGVPEGHKCGRVHGHTFTIEIHACGEVDSTTGWVVDFSDVGKIFKPIHDQLDHNYLNDIPGLENPTSENIAKWIWPRLKPSLPQLCRIVIKESPSSACIYDGD